MADCQTEASPGQGMTEHPRLSVAETAAAVAAAAPAVTGVPGTIANTQLKPHLLITRKCQYMVTTKHTRRLRRPN